MMTLLEAVREVLGTSEPWFDGGMWQYHLMFEYLVCALILLIVVSSVFKIVCRLFK